MRHYNLHLPDCSNVMTNTMEKICGIKVNKLVLNCICLYLAYFDVPPKACHKVLR